MKIVIELYGEVAEKYMKDRLAETMRRLIAGNKWACERGTAIEIKKAFRRSRIVRDDTNGMKGKTGVTKSFK